GGFAAVPLASSRLVNWPPMNTRLPNWATASTSWAYPGRAGSAGVCQLAIAVEENGMATPPGRAVVVVTAGAVVVVVPPGPPGVPGEALGRGAVPTMGLAGGLAPSEPWNGRLEKAKMPPSEATMR